MTRRVLASHRHELVIYPGKVDWPRVLGFGLAVALVAFVLIGRAS